jgi:hypothetical protein
MKKIYSLLFLLLSSVTFAQTFYSENMGTPSGNTLIPAYVTGTAPATFQNSSPILYSGTGSVRTSTPSTSAYNGASGNGNVFMNVLTGVGQNFQIDGLNTSAYQTANLQLSFGYLTTATTNQVVIEKSTDGTNWSPITFTNNTNTSWNLITISGGQIPSSLTLSLRFTNASTTNNQGIRIDDVKLSNVSASCTLNLGNPTVLCEASTINIDTYTVTIPYTGGGNATYTVTPSSGTVGGDNPSTVAAGNITVSGVTEGTNFSATITGGTCDLTATAISPECKPILSLPLYENFDYTVGTSLASTQRWSNTNSGDTVDVVSGSLTYANYPSSANAVSYSGAGSDPFTRFTTTTAGTVYTSFLLNVTDMGTITDLAENVVAAVTGDAPSTFRLRLFFKRNGTQYQLGCTAATTTTAATFDPTLLNTGTVVAVVIGYDFTANQLKMWLNPDFSTFTNATPASITETPTVTPPATSLANLGGFLLRQDTNTPAITFDELRIAETTTQLLSSSSFNAIAGLKIYPNPSKNGVVFIETAANAERTIVFYDILGKKVFNTTTSETAVNVNNLRQGVYIVKITEEGKTATRKLVIE